MTDQLSSLPSADAKRRESAQRVEDNVLGQLTAAARFPDDVNRSYAAMWRAFFESTAARAGMLPHELMDRYGVEVRAEQLPAATRAIAEPPFRPDHAHPASFPRLASEPPSLLAVRQQWAAAGIENFVFELGGTIQVSQFIVRPWERGQGIGTAAMRVLLDYADLTGQRITLTPSTDFGGSKARLLRFYKRLGFVENRGRNRDFTTREGMIREAQAIDTPDAQLAQRYGQAAWHGTPHAFERFSTDHIGTGEGAQSYGWGLYFASNRRVAGEYRDTLNNRWDKIAVRGQVLADQNSDVANAVRSFLRGEAGNFLTWRKTTAARMRGAAANGPGQGRPARAAELRLAAAEIESLKRADVGNKGQVYRVELPAAEGMLDWDEPLGQQPAILTLLEQHAETFFAEQAQAAGMDLDAYESMLVETRAKYPPQPLASQTGEAYYRVLSAFFEDPRAASLYLKDAGVPAIKYRDAGSRDDDATAPTYNFVVFDDGDVQRADQRAKPADVASPTTAAVDTPGEAGVDTFNQSAWHGSPYRFDRFTTEKIGAGEGAQSFGWGMYFAGHKDVADLYRVRINQDKQQALYRARATFKMASSDVDKLRRWLEGIDSRPVTRDGKPVTDAWLQAQIADYQVDVEYAEKVISELDEVGHLYNVEIPEDDQLLDWDAPLNRQPARVRAALRDLYNDVDDDLLTEFDDALLAALTGDGPLDIPKQPRNPTGADVYQQLSRLLGGDKAASRALAKLGVEGIRYLDQISRVAGEGTRNYVVFRDESVRVLETLFQSAWHGSPHSFERFSTSRIGTGEGAQAYGHGLYFAQNRDVAEGYRKTLARAHGTVEVKVNGRLRRGDSIRYAVEKLADERDTVSQEDLANHFRERIDVVERRGVGAGDGNPALKAALLRELRAALKSVETATSVEVRIEKKAGQLYKVEIPDEQVLLDWDAPLTSQPAAVQAALLGVEQDRVRQILAAKVAQRDQLAATGAPTPRLDRQIEILSEDLGSTTLDLGGTGRTYYQALEAKLGSAEAASQALRALGILGIRYLDRDSRHAGEGTRNYVIFDDEAVRVIETLHQSTVAAEAIHADDESPAVPDTLTKWFGASHVEIAADAANFARMYADQYAAGEPGHADPSTLEWLEVTDYPISRLLDAVDKEWFAAEQKMWADEGEPTRFDDILNEPFANPVVVFDDGQGGWTWDGNHRIGAQLTKGIPTIRALVGVKREQLQQVLRDTAAANMAPPITSPAAPVVAWEAFMLDACEAAEAGFHFEEGGCWGMALALQREIGGQLVVRRDFLHCYVELDGHFYDYTGLAKPPTEYERMTREHLYEEAQAAGFTRDEVDADVAWAERVIAGAKERHTDEMAEVGTNNDAAPDATFEQWFAGSQAVDSEGAPLLLFHGTDGNFTRFEHPAFFTNNQDEAAEYGATIHQAYVSIKRPKHLDSFDQQHALQNDEIARYAALGYDGFIGEGAGGIHYVAFSPEQIVSAVGRAPAMRMVPTPGASDASGFADWFKGSRIVDEGEPLVVYHGTASEFDPANFRVGSYFTRYAGQADQYAANQAEAHGGLARTIPVLLCIKNPAIVTDEFIEWAGSDPAQREALRRAGFDGMMNASMSEIVPFDANQIKPASVPRASPQTAHTATEHADGGVAAPAHVSLKSLPDDMQDLVSSFLEDHDVKIPKRLVVREIALDRFPVDYRLAGGNDARGVDHAQAMIGKKLPAIIVCGDTWLDGHHRVWAARAAGESSILAIDIAPEIGTLRAKAIRLGQLLPQDAKAPTGPVTASPAFRKWFGKSAVVDATGAPQVVFHGTPAHFSEFDPRRIKGFNEGPGFYFTNNRQIATGYGQPIEAYLAIQKPLAYDAKPFSKTVLTKIVRRVAEVQAQRSGEPIADGYLSNYGDVRSDGLAAVVKEAVASLCIDDCAVDQIAGIMNSGVPHDVVATAVHEVTGHDGIVANGFSNEGHGDNQIYVAWFPQQIKSATGNCGTFDAHSGNIFHQASPASATRAARGDPGALTAPPVRGQIALIKKRDSQRSVISLFDDADRSTFLHESGHFFLEVHSDLAARAGAGSPIRRDFEATLDWMGVRAQEPLGSARNPLPMTELANAQPGQWLAETFPDLRGTPVVQLRQLDAKALSGLYLPELDENGRLQPDRRGYVPGYAARMLRGEQAPPVRIVEMEDGRLRVVDGHRRVMAALQSGRPLSALVSPMVDHEGTKVPLTKELAPARSAVETWRAMTAAQRRPHHEQFARGFERYLMEGHAPTPGLQSMFARFRSWLVGIYKSVANLAVRLTPEVRAVMGRMVAGEEADLAGQEPPRERQPGGDRAAENQRRLRELFIEPERVADCDENPPPRPSTENRLLDPALPDDQDAAADLRPRERC